MGRLWTILPDCQALASSLHFTHSVEFTHCACAFVMAASLAQRQSRVLHWHEKIHADHTSKAVWRWAAYLHVMVVSGMWTMAQRDTVAGEAAARSETSKITFMVAESSLMRSLLGRQSVQLSSSTCRVTIHRLNQVSWGDSAVLCTAEHDVVLRCHDYVDIQRSPRVVVTNENTSESLLQKMTLREAIWQKPVINAHRVHVLNPDRIYRTIKYEPFWNVTAGIDSFSDKTCSKPIFPFAIDSVLLAIQFSNWKALRVADVCLHSPCFSSTITCIACIIDCLQQHVEQLPLKLLWSIGSLSGAVGHCKHCERLAKAQHHCQHQQSESWQRREDSSKLHLLSILCRVCFQDAHLQNLVASGFPRSCSSHCASEGGKQVQQSRQSRACSNMPC